MSMQDLAGALAPAGPPPDPTDAYGGGGGGMGGMGGIAPDRGLPPDQGPPPDQGAAPPGQGQYETSLDALDGAEEALHAFIQIDPDEADRAVAAQCLQNILKLKAKNQSEQQGGGGMTSLARALQSTTGPGA